ncbi:hypothetical protein KSS87_013217 [Heliosperma pusillum]|nr:hypothetical protein KSS87_013217 [Heliosperma pusillum]
MPSHIFIKFFLNFHLNFSYFLACNMRQSKSCN